MNDRDWFKKRRRGKRGGCAFLVTAATAAGVAGLAAWLGVWLA